MKTFKLPFSETEIDVNNEGVITRVSSIDFVENIIELKLSDYRVVGLGITYYQQAMNFIESIIDYDKDISSME